MITFEVSEEQALKIKGWHEAQDKIVLEQQRKERADALPNPNHDFRDWVNETGHPYYGAIGGEVSYIFTPTSIGVILSVKHSGTKAELSFYDDL